MSIEDRLAETLNDRARAVSGRPLTLGAVEDSARRLRRRHRTRAVVTSATFAVVLAAVMGGVIAWSAAPAEDVVSAATPVTDAAELAGTWRVVAVDGRPAPATWISTGAAVTVDIEVNQTAAVSLLPGTPLPWWLHPTGVCIPVAASISVAGGRLDASQVPDNQMASCVQGDALGVQVVGLAAGADSARYPDGDGSRLELLAGDDVVLELVRVPDVPVRDAAQLAGDWAVREIDGFPRSRGPADVDWPVIVTFDHDPDRVDPDGSPTTPLVFSARFDCNTSGGSVAVASGRFSAEVVTVTQVLCGGEYTGTLVAERFARADAARFAAGDETLLELLDGDQVVLTMQLLRRPERGLPVRPTLSVDSPVGQVRSPYALDGTLTFPDGRAVEVPRGLWELVASPWGYVAHGEPVSPQAEASLYVLDTSGEVRRRMDAGSGFAVSDDGEVLAYPTPEGRLLLERLDPGLSEDERVVELPTPTGTLTVVALAEDEGTTCATAVSDCRVHYEVRAADGTVTVGSSTASAGTRTEPGLVALGAVGHGRTAAATEIVESPTPGSCWTVRPSSGEGAGWSTCRRSLDAFGSPYAIVGVDSYRDGEGSRTLSIYNPMNGALRVDVAVSGVVTQWAWESDDSLVVVLLENGRRHLARVTTYGTVERLPVDPLPDGAVIGLFSP